MAKRKLTDGEVITALMTFRTITDAAKALGVTRQTVYNYLATEGFDEKLRQAQLERDEHLATIRETTTVQALDCLTRIMTDKSLWTSDQDKIQAARTVLEFVR